MFARIEIKQIIETVTDHHTTKIPKTRTRYMLKQTNFCLDLKNCNKKTNFKQT